MTIAQKLEIRNEHHYLWTGRRFQVDSQVMQDVYFLPTSRVKIIIMQISSLKNYIFAISIFNAQKNLNRTLKLWSTWLFQRVQIIFKSMN